MMIDVWDGPMGYHGTSGGAAALTTRTPSSDSFLSAVIARRAISHSAYLRHAKALKRGTMSTSSKFQRAQPRKYPKKRMLCREGYKTSQGREGDEQAQNMFSSQRWKEFSSGHKLEAQERARCLWCSQGSKEAAAPDSENSKRNQSIFRRKEAKRTTRPKTGREEANIKGLLQGDLMS
eukprot:6202898-Pleurochrysis_carterae.AAC.2